jgi:hypothetical protein
VITLIDGDHKRSNRSLISAVTILAIKAYGTSIWFSFIGLNGYSAFCSTYWEAAAGAHLYMKITVQHDAVTSGEAFLL